jgi:cytochrome c5
VKQAFAVLVLFVAGFAFAERVPPGTDEQIKERLKPAGELCKAGDPCGQSVAAAAGGAARTGEQVYNQFCFACHGTGVSGAPKMGHPDDWAPRLAKGEDVLLKNAIAGINAMPPKGTCMNCTDEEIKITIEYMSKAH